MDSSLLGLLENIFAFRLAVGHPELAPALAFTVPVVLMHLATFLGERSLLPRDETGGGRALLAGVMLYLIVTCYGTSQAFIYFQF